VPQQRRIHPQITQMAQICGNAWRRSVSNSAFSAERFMRRSLEGNLQDRECVTSAQSPDVFCAAKASGATTMLRSSGSAISEICGLLSLHFPPHPNPLPPGERGDKAQHRGIEIPPCAGEPSAVSLQPSAPRSDVPAAESVKSVADFFFAGGRQPPSDAGHSQKTLTRSPRSSTSTVSSAR